MATPVNYRTSIKLVLFYNLKPRSSARIYARLNIAGASIMEVRLDIRPTTTWETFTELRDPILYSPTIAFRLSSHKRSLKDHNIFFQRNLK